MTLQRVKITNGTTRTKAFKVFGGTEDVKPNETRVLELEVSDSEAFARKMQALEDAGVIFRDPDEPIDAADAPVDPDRQAAISAAIGDLSSEDFTKGGKPEVDAINAAMPEGAEAVTAAERDAVWTAMQAQ